MQASLDQNTIEFAKNKFAWQVVPNVNLYRMAYSEKDCFPNGKWFTTNKEYAKCYKETHEKVALEQNINNKPYLYECQIIKPLNLMVYKGSSFSSDMHEIYSVYSQVAVNNAKIIDRLEFIMKDKAFASIDGFLMHKDGSFNNTPIDEYFIPNTVGLLRMVSFYII